ncbi:uncharacterized protein LOC141719830 [Apium graveolens]|uniref:uncharacterized protein LOC141719830 n=1 Tax=Apium graveolens TaxID=4045 RepID=UPI003D7B19D4
MEKLWMACFKCGKVGHIEKNYKELVQRANVLRITRPPLPTPPVQPRARTLNMTVKDVVQDANVIAGMLIINSIEGKTLIDSGAIRSSVFENFVDKLNCVTHPLKSKLVIEVANQDRVTVDRRYPNYDIILEGCHFSVDLIPFMLRELDVILGMNWLRNHDAQIECKDNKQGDCYDKDVKPILAHVIDFSKESPKMEENHVVCEFLNVFPDVLPGLPPDQEIEFTIDLAPGTEPFSKAPYRMAPVKMKLLAMQLQELLDEGVIRSILSPWVK